MVNMIVMPKAKRMEIVMGIQVYLIPRMNLDYKENSGKKSFSCKSKHQYYASQFGEHDCSANNKKIGDYYEYPSSSLFANNL